MTYDTSFNYNDWGVLEATVTDVFDDISISTDGNNYFYKIYCSLNSDHLTLKNGYKGFIKKEKLYYEPNTKPNTYQLCNYNRFSDMLYGRE